MPFYDLRCTACKTEFNVMASISDKTQGHIDCPACGSKTLETMFKSAPYILKSRKTADCMGVGHQCGANCPHAH